MDRFIPLPKKKAMGAQQLDEGLAPSDDMGPDYRDLPEEHALYTNADPMKRAIQNLRNKIEAQKDTAEYY